MIISNDALSIIKIYDLLETTLLPHFLQLFFVVAQHILKYEKYHVRENEHRFLSLNQIVS